MYGPDKGMLEHFILLIHGALKLKIQKVSYSGISLRQLANSLSLFDDREIIVVQNYGSSIDKDDKIALQENLHNFLILLSDELPTNSSLRQFFEKNLNLACIACYPDSKSDLKVVARRYLLDSNKSIDEEALEYLCDNLNNDRQILYNELNKLVICSRDTRINLDDTKKIVAASRSFVIDKLSIALANKDVESYFKGLDDLFTTGSSEILVIRSLIRYYVNIYIAKLKVIAGVDIEEVCKSLKPPVFFMYANQFKDIVKKTKISEALKILKKLNLSEIELKSTNKHSRNVFESIFYQQV